MKNYSFAIVRDVPNSYSDCVTLDNDNPQIDVPKAQSQHLSYCNALSNIGLKVIHIGADESLPDCCFTEDTSILIDDLAIITYPGTPSRVQEVIEVEKVLLNHKNICKIVPPATIEGGDVLVIDNKVYIGLSTRTNMEGIRQVASFLKGKNYQVISVPVTGILHLKSACTYLGNNYVIMASKYIDKNLFSEYKIIELSEEYEYCANCLNINGKVIMPKGYDKIKTLIESIGFEVIELEMTEFKKGDGSLTCLSLLF